MFIKASLKPSERVTGGPWYSDNRLDEGYVDALLKIIYCTIRDESSYRSMHSSREAGSSTKQPKKGILKGSEAAVAKGRKRPAENISEEGPGSVAVGAERKAKKAHRDVNRLPLPAGYTKYPTTWQIAQVMAITDVSTADVLKEAEIQQLIDVLVYDGLVEGVHLPQSGKTGYRVTNISRLDDKMETARGQQEAALDQLGAPLIDNGFTEAPCGRCPVFDLCEVGGPVSPSNCVYFRRWLGLEVEEAPRNEVSDDDS
jgi:DNA-directed RNA polymerase III subunit RPC6